MTEILLHRMALRYLKKCAHPDRERLRKAIAQLVKEPENFPGMLHMAGEWVGYRRIRVGGFRVIFWYDSEKDIVYIDHIGPRGDVYKR
jgi:mRNA interferase RelE/StbE